MSVVIAVIALIATFIFGAWAIKSFNVAQTANDLSREQLQAQQDPHTADALNLSNDGILLNAQLSLALLCAMLGPVWSLDLLYEMPMANSKRHLMTPAPMCSNKAMSLIL